MKRLLLAIILSTMIGHIVEAQTITTLNLVIFPGGLSWPVFVAREKGFFDQEHLAVKIAVTSGSVPQIRGILSGDYDIAMTPFDNVVAYQEGQGEITLDPPPDLFAFMGGISSSLRLIVRPGISSFAALKDSVLGVDALSTGYTLAMYYILDHYAVPPDSYRLERLGGTASRVRALIEGKISGTMVSAPQDIPLEEDGYKRLGDVQPMLGSYQALSGVARRSWAAANPGRLTSFIRAYVAACDWLADPANRPEAAEIYARNIPNSSRTVIDKAWEDMFTKAEGFQAHAKFDPKGAQTVLDIRNRYGIPKKELADWHKYVDESFYNKALDVGTP